MSMTWFFIALIAQFLHSFVNITDQYLVAKYSTGERGSGGLIFFSAIMGLVSAIFIGIFASNIFVISYLDKFLLAISGAITIIWFVLYLYTLEIEDVSAVVPWFLTVPVFGYALGYIFLGETLSMQQLIGALIVLLGVLVISINFAGEKRKFKTLPAIYMLIVCFLIAIQGVIFKFVTIGENFWVSSFWQGVGWATFGLLVFILAKKYRNEFLAMIKTGGKTIFALNTLGEVLTISGNLLINYALLLAPVAMVYLVGSFQPFIILFLTLLGTKFFPHVVKENLERKVLIPKILGLAVMIVGSVLLFI